MRTIDVDTGNVRKITENINAELCTIAGQIKGTYDAVAQMDAMWKGPAKDAFVLQFEQDAIRFAEICNDLIGYKEKMEQACETYEKGEKSVADIINAIRI